MKIKKTPDMEFEERLQHLFNKATTGDKEAVGKISELEDMLLQESLKQGKRFDSVLHDEEYSFLRGIAVSQYNELIEMVDMLPDKRHRKKLRKKVKLLYQYTISQENAAMKFCDDPVRLLYKGYRRDWTIDSTCQSMRG